MCWYTSSKLWAFVGGIAAAGIASGAVKCPKCREAAVKGVSRGILVKEQVEAKLQSVKDDAEDLCAEARQEAKVAAELAAKRAEIEARIRALVEAEMAEAAA